MSSTVNRAELEVVLEGIPLPAGRTEVVEYAAGNGADGATLAALRALPDRRYESIDEVGETVDPVQPVGSEPRIVPPRAESGAPPGGDAYTGS